jgi:tetratricopeptide (TPR) repeat protein
VAVAAGCGDGASSPQGGEALASVLPRAEELAGRGLPHEAAELLAGRLESLPASERGEALAAMARFYRRANSYKLSLDAAERALAAGAERPEVLYYVADARRHLHLPGAEETLEKCVAAAPDFHPAALALARMRFRSSDPASALPFFEVYFGKAPASDPEYTLALLEHGRALRAAGRLQEAADRFMSLLEAQPFERQGYSELAAALYRLRLRKEARFVEEIYKVISQNAFEDDAEDRLREQGSTAFALGQRAINSTREKRYLEAFRSYLAALSIDRADPRLRSFYADLCIHFRRFRDAHRVLEQALRVGLQPSSGLLWMLGRLHLEMDDDRAALDAFRRAAGALEREGDAGGPDQGQAPRFSLHLALARAAIEAGDLPSADQAVAAAGAGAPASWEPLYWRGRVHLERGDAGGAAAQFAEAAKRGGQSLIDLRYWSAIAAEKGGDRALAERELEEVARSSPGFIPAREALARLAGPARGAERQRALGEARAAQAAVKAREESIDSLPLEKCGEDYLELAKLLRGLKDPSFADFLFIAGELLPASAEAQRLIVGVLRQPHDAFVRQRHLLRLHKLAPDDDQAILAIADMYVKLHVRLDEAARLAERLHAIKPSARTWRLRGEAALARGEREKAVDILRQAAAAHPGDADVKAALARAEAGG